MIKVSSLAISIWQIFLMIYSKIFYEDLITFFGVINSERFFGNSTGDNLRKKKRRNKKKMVIDRNTKIPEAMPKFLVKSSSTYFQFSKLTNEISNSLNKISSNLKLKNKFIQKQINKSKKIVSARKITDKLGYAKEDLNEVPEKNNELKEESIQNNNNNNRSYLGHSFAISDKDLSFKIENLANDIYMQDGKNNAFNGSFIKDPEQSVSNCIICFANPPDTVIMECGHGGICNECAVDIWKRANECYLCRKKITSIIQIDLKGGIGIYRPIIAVTKKIPKTFKEGEEDSDSNANSQINDSNINE